MSGFAAPPDWGRPPPMPAAEQLREAARQVAGLTVEELQGAAWRAASSCATCWSAA